MIQFPQTMDLFSCSQARSFLCCCSNKRNSSQYSEDDTICIVTHNPSPRENVAVYSDSLIQYGSVAADEEPIHESSLSCSLMTLTQTNDTATVPFTNTISSGSPLKSDHTHSSSNHLSERQGGSFASKSCDVQSDATTPHTAAPLPSLGDLIKSIPGGKLETTIVMSLVETFISVLSSGTQPLPPLSLLTSQALIQRNIQVTPLKPAIISYLRTQCSAPSSLTALVEPLLLRLMSIATDGRGHILFSFNFNEVPVNKADPLAPFYNMTSPSKEKTFTVTLPSLPIWVLPSHSTENDIGAAIKSDSGSHTLVLKDRVMVRIGTHGIQSVRAGDICLYKAMLTLSLSLRCEHSQWTEETDLLGRKVLQSRLTGIQTSKKSENGLFPGSTVSSPSIITTEPVIARDEDGKEHYVVRGSRWWLGLSAAGLGIRIALPDIDP